MIGMGCTKACSKCVLSGIHYLHLMDISNRLRMFPSLMTKYSIVEHCSKLMIRDPMVNVNSYMGFCGSEMELMTNKLPGGKC